MSPFEAIQYVTGGFTLAAFVAVLVARVARTALRRKEQLIRAAPEAERGRLVEVGLEGFHVATTDLTRDQKFSLLTTQMDHRAGRWQRATRFATVATLTAGVVTLGVMIAPQFFTEKTETEELVDTYDRVMISNYQHEMYTDAEHQAERILELDPTHFRALSVKGSVAIYENQPQTAVKYFTKALESAPDSVTIKLNLAYGYVEIGAYQRAIELYESIQDGSAPTANLLGRAYVIAGDYEKGLTHLQGVPDSHERGHARILEAAAHVGLSQHESDSADQTQHLAEAKTALERGVAQDPEYWRGVLSGARVDIHMSYTRSVELLSPMFRDVSGG